MMSFQGRQQGVSKGRYILLIDLLKIICYLYQKE